jgi:hypothetical protein
VPGLQQEEEPCRGSSVPELGTISHSPKSGLPSLATRALAILAEEVGLSASEMTDDLNLLDPSLLSLGPI